MTLGLKGTIAYSERGNFPLGALVHVPTDHQRPAFAGAHPDERITSMPMLRYLPLVAILAATCMAPAAWAVDTPKAEIEALQRRVEAEPANPDAHFDLAMGLGRTVKLESGYTALKKVHDLDPTYADKVIARYKPMVEENKLNIEAQFRLAFGYFFKGYGFQLDADAAKGDPAKVDALRAESAKYKGMARTSFESILEVDPKYVWGYNYLGFLFGEANNLDQALTVLKKGLEVEDNAVGHFLIGQIYIKQGNMAGGVAEISTAMRMRGLNP